MNVTETLNAVGESLMATLPGGCPMRAVSVAFFDLKLRRSGRLAQGRWSPTQGLFVPGGAAGPAKAGGVCAIAREFLPRTQVSFPTAPEQVDVNGRPNVLLASGYLERVLGLGHVRQVWVPVYGKF